MDQDQRQAIKNSSDVDALLTLLRDSKPDALVGRDYDVIDRAVERFSGAAVLSLAYLGNHTLDMLPRHVTAHAAIAGLITRAHIGPYGQYFQAVLDPGSKLHAFAPDVIVLALSLSQIVPEVCSRFVEMSEADLRAALAHILDHIDEWLTAARQATEATLLVSNFVRPVHSQAGIADQKLPYSEAEFYAELNLALLSRYRNDSRVRILDLHHAASLPGLASRTNEKMRYLAKIELAPEWLPSISDVIVRHLRAIRGHARKCLVLDLDNTLWGGVVGEDGATGLKIGGGSPVGEAYRDLQSVVRTLKYRGIVLALSSKNNEADVLDVFASRPEMQLTLDDFLIRHINWRPKHENIKEIAAKLNLGLESLVFIDDNPVECALVREHLPEVKVIHLDGDPADFKARLLAMNDFEKLQITAEDAAKSEQYKVNEVRANLREETGDLDAFLLTLQTQVFIRPADPEDAPRVHQLFSKTNQFNLTTKRYTQAEIERFIRGGNWRLLVVNVSDRFGDLGMVGLCLLDQSTSDIAIDSFILSCRAMGRKIETAMMNEIKRRCLIDDGARCLIGSYVPTRKNIPVLHFYENEGFILLEKAAGGENTYHFTGPDWALGNCPGINVRIS